MSVFHRAGVEEGIKGVDALLQERLDAALTAWHQPRQRLVQSVGKYEAESETVVVLKSKGKIIHSMGFHWRGQKRLFMEEAMFLVEQGYLLVFQETLQNCTQLLSLQDTLELMVAAGVPVQRYSIYADLKRNGYATFRYPLRLSLEADANPKSIWEAWLQNPSPTDPQQPSLLIYGVYGLASHFKRSLPPPPEKLIASVASNSFSVSTIAELESTREGPVVLAFVSGAEIVYYEVNSMDSLLHEPLSL